MVGRQAVNPIAASAADRTTSRTSDEVQCPRCGYDLRGAVQSWRDACPLDGRCTECGLGFEWADLYTRPLHRWLFEHQWRRRPVRSALFTMIMPLGGRRISRELTLMQPIRLAPLIWLLAGLLLATLALRTGRIWYAEGLIRTRWGAWWTPATNISQDVLSWLRFEFQFFVLCLAPAFVLPLLAFRAIPTSLRRIKVRRAHLVRVWLYWLIAAASIALLLAFVQFGYVWITSDDLPYALMPSQWEFLSFTDGGMSTVIFMTVKPLWFVVMVWAFGWWWFACRNYLRLPDAGLTATLLMTIVLIASYLITFIGGEVLNWNWV